MTGLTDSFGLNGFCPSLADQENKASSRRVMNVPVARSNTQTAIHLLVKAEVKVIECFMRVAESAAFFGAPVADRLDESLIGNQNGDQIKIGAWLGLA